MEPSRKRPGDRDDEIPEKLKSEDENYVLHRNVLSATNSIVQFKIIIYDESHNTMGVRLYRADVTESYPRLTITVSNNKATLVSHHLQYFDDNWRQSETKEFANQQKALTVVLSKLISGFEPIVVIENAANSYLPVAALADALKESLGGRTPITTIIWTADFDEHFPRLLKEAGSKQLILEIGDRPGEINHLMTDQYINETVIAISESAVNTVYFRNTQGDINLHNDFPEYSEAVVSAQRKVPFRFDAPLSAHKLRKIIEKWINNPTAIVPILFEAQMPNEDEEALSNLLTSNPNFTKAPGRDDDERKSQIAGVVTSPNGPLKMLIHITERRDNYYTGIVLQTFDKP